MMTMMTNVLRTYSNLIKLKTFDERLDYLKLYQNPGDKTFGSLRGYNQSFYRSREWKNVREFVLIRDQGLDLGVIGYEITSRFLVHHMNPVVPDDLFNNTHLVLDPEFLITTQFNTHQLIHYSSNRLYSIEERKQGDTTLWK